MASQEPEGAVAARFADLAGKTAIVTGSARGIGLGIATFLGRQGMRIMLAGRAEEPGDEVAQALRRQGIDCEWLGGDLALMDRAKAVFDRAVERFSRIDVLVNNAANLRSLSILDLNEQAFHETCERNIRLFYNMSYIVVPHMIASGGGAIVNVSSVGGLRAHQGAAGYDAAKGAMNALTRSMAIDLAKHNIRVNAIAPGATNSHPEWAASEHGRRHHAEKTALIPLGRMGNVEDMAAAAAFLASAAASYITGQILYVDGGLTAQLSPPGLRV
ncbi:MAG: glucose 1-dehydrogenase [Planctomycetes bacterium]|nr:glucose 1-dehydrogenase [Planctomycetota bacterium]